MKLPVSTVPIRGPWLDTPSRRSMPMVAYSVGGLVINVDTDDLRAAEWTAVSDGTNITIEREGVEPVVYLTDTGITQIALALDGSMRPHFAYVANGVCKFWYWDSLAGAYATMVIDGGITPRLCLDDSRANFTNDRDVVFCYMRGTTLYARYQRDRYTIETLLINDPNAIGLVNVGMSTVLRLQWKLQPKPGYVPP